MNSRQSIREIESWIGAVLPLAYREFLNACQTELMVGEQVLLYGRSLLIERNQTYQTKEFCPEYITIGNDSGDMEFIMSLETESIHMVDGGSMRLSQAESLNTSFAPWFAAGCPIPQFEHDPIDWPADPLDRVLVYLNKKPADLQVLLVLKHALGISISIGDLKRGLDKLPFLLNNSSYAAARVGCARICQLEPCVEIRLASDPTVKLPIQMANEA